MKKPSFSYRCPCGVTLSLIGGKYKIVILWHLYQKAPVRFNELHRLIPEATTKMFTQQLRELEADGLVERKAYPVIPPRVEYSLTAFGRSVLPVLEAMNEWGAAYLAARGE